MLRPKRNLLAAVLLVAAAGAASAGVTVTYEHPDNYRDMPFSPVDREEVLRQLTEHFNKLAQELPAGQDLRITVEDLDLAGRIEPARWNFNNDIRLMRGGADWPTMKLRYTLEQNGQVLRSGETTISNMMYLDRLNRYSSGDPLRYEKQMVDDWYKNTISSPKLSSK
ncbi:DUF3016 domain-containing protein [Massilia endophytica]|uniref:DUF3016 domain-containing protein n=1 Tax=Massilia endophytica TaxID=2899220 RepID=UPI001E442BB0|nr:DUF3016 domain-containing protein [Massilia endophytica]UGQ46887.1 DUF3016 domain-containing protein [Massilia endophytica]